MKFETKGLSSSFQKELYTDLITPRLIEEKMLLLLRKGKISKWFSGIGQEAIAVGATRAMKEDEWIMPLHRNLGVFTTRKLSLTQLFQQLQGRVDGFSKGRERSFHFGVKSHKIWGMISHLGPQLSVASGVALAHKLKEENKVSLAFTGEGGTSEGEFHEALNTAAVWKLPVIFLIENNGYALSTPVDEQYACKHLVDRAVGYGMPGQRIDGNNVIDVYRCIDYWAQKIRKEPGPVLIECDTFRMRGHEEASGTKYVPDELFEEWGEKDPVDNYERYLKKNKILSSKEIAGIREEMQREIDESLDQAIRSDKPGPDIKRELGEVYMLHKSGLPENAGGLETEELRYVDAISNGLEQAMNRYPNLVLMGQDVGKYGGVFKITADFIEKFGKERVRNTPLCESAILGIGAGLSGEGMKAMVEMQFADFVSVGFNQIVNNLAKLFYRWGQNADVVVRMPTGAGVGAGPFHSQSNEAWFFHVPGLKVVYPSNPFDAKGLLLSAIEDPNPVLFFEHKMLYRSVKGQVPKSEYGIPLGKARVVLEGSDASIVTYGAGVEWAKALVDEFPDHSLELIDLRSLLPWDKETVEASVKKTSKLLVLHEDTQTGGIGGEIASYIAENCFEYLDGPVMRLGSLDTPVPFAPGLEEDFLAKKRFKEKLQKLLEF